MCGTTSMGFMRRDGSQAATRLSFGSPRATDYTFDLDAVRVPQKYPGKKYYKGPRAGQYSSNPLGKNPGDVWIIPNVKHNHPEKTIHPCQFPVELIERLVLSLTSPGDLVVDPFMGVGTTAVAALKNDRRAVGAEIEPDYHSIAHERVQMASKGELKTRPMTRPVYEPPANSALTKPPVRSTPHVHEALDAQLPLR